LQQVTLADWGPRAIGLLIDWAIIVGATITSVILGQVEVALFALGFLAVFALSVYFAVQVGRTGQSPGMRVVGLRCVGMHTGQPIGGGLGFVRSMAHFVDSVIGYIGWLLPLWDRQRQTLADKIMNTVVVVVPKQGFSLVPPKT
jgi:uncharacterized RDD family membrane protein YckC